MSNLKLNISCRRYDYEKIILVTTLVFIGLFADAFDLKYDDKEKWNLLEQYYKDVLTSSEKETLKIKELHYEKVGEDVYFCWYNVKYNSKRGEKKDFDKAMKIIKDNDGKTILSFQTKRYELKY